ncbi:lectin like domain-containing protein [Methanohalophilus portucalensis]|uniref:PGF-pre-PGF domain-containing protein n=2 Tax=Methanohalophilus portucalensis TaxID=39664 RepID=A0A1X7P1I4_9EURY|nr:lectin like domain-containing protein [Methanohalophilus portucalensis]ATU08081.1 hypothetical protein BKM01_04390 [Methanohalophilus portucalensis]RNI10058.1 PGF-pre-PGF domain-containing protein [Methanohalophilus portucalensis FDF-1]SMH44461.1 PGF-pre-PGF domain-containing protein [Methanohalophilus portucalensis FDF-1]
MFKKLIFLSVITIILFNTAVMASENNPEITSAPLNPQFVDYQSGLQDSDSKNTIMATSADRNEYPLGLVPSPVDMGHLQHPEPDSNRLFAAQSFKVSYDLRKENRLTPVKDQGNTGSCWTFATYASLESCTYEEGPYNFSENHMKNILSNDNPNDSFDSEQGGNMLMATAYLTRWSGPVNETDDSYNDTSSFNDYTNPDKPVAGHIQEIIYLPTRSNFTDEEYQISDDDYLKEAVMEYGAVYSYFMVKMSAFADNYTTYYYNESAYDGGHAVALVGWNDSFPKEKFNIIPPGDGAFILKNSWGTGTEDFEIGEEGYFYISYYEKSFNDHSGHPAILIATEDADNYDNIYQYDPLGYTDSRGFSNSTTAHGANVFQTVSEEYLEAVSFYTTDTNAVYNVSIYTNLSSSAPVGENLLAQTNGTFAHAGYHTVTLDTPVHLEKGLIFSVVTRLCNPDYEYPLAIEKPLANYSSKASANPNESFISPDGSNWTDVGELNDTNICIKAFTSAPPSKVSNLHATTGPSWINWTWSNPEDTDFNHTEIYIDGSLMSTTSDTHYNLTGLLDGTNHSIGLKTVDTDGYVNSTWVNNTSQTIDVVPASVTGLHDVSSTSDSITWEWSNQAIHDFDHVEVYFDGLFETNVSDFCYTATNLKPAYSYNLSLKTVDRGGNINHTWINDTASTRMQSSPEDPEITSEINKNVSFYAEVSHPGNMTWYVNSTEVQNKTNVNRSYYNSTADKGCWNVTVIVKSESFSANRSWLWHVTDKPDKPSSPPSSGSSGGVGGGGNNGESYANILAKTVQIQKVSAGTDVMYEFDEKDNEVSFIGFRGATNSGQVKATIEKLKDTSSLVDERAPGQVYSNFNIWVGNAAFDAENMKDPVIGFKVSKNWLSENRIMPSMITLFHYGDKWQALETVQTEEDAEYFYFEAQADHFSPFAISALEQETGLAKSSKSQPGDVAEESATETNSENTTDTTKTNSIPAPGVFPILGIFCILYVMRRRL